MTLLLTDSRPFVLNDVAVNVQAPTDKFVIVAVVWFVTVKVTVAFALPAVNDVFVPLTA